eukprot:scaffold29298_cov152-Skeletonema_dohrnii-CCMP3373.AAC.5
MMLCRGYGGPGLIGVYHDQSISQPTSEPMLESLFMFHVAKKRKLPPSVHFYIGIQCCCLTAEQKLMAEEALLASIGNRQSA